MSKTEINIIVIPQSYHFKKLLHENENECSSNCNKYTLGMTNILSDIICNEKR